MGGFNHGYIAKFERLQNWPLLYVHCFFHNLEEIFRHIFVNYAGPTTGPNSWSGKEAKRLTGNVWELEVVEFEPVPSPVLWSLLEDIPLSVLKEFNHDTRYLIEMARAVESGSLEERLAQKQAGMMTNA